MWREEERNRDRRIGHWGVLSLWCPRWDLQMEKCLVVGNRVEFRIIEINQISHYRLQHFPLPNSCSDTDRRRLSQRMEAWDSLT